VRPLKLLNISLFLGIIESQRLLQGSRVTFHRRMVPPTKMPITNHRRTHCGQRGCHCGGMRVTRGGVSRGSGVAIAEGFSGRISQKKSKILVVGTETNL
jgi:hypothetical protein